MDPKRILVILNDPPYGTERSWNGLRLAGALARAGHRVRVFLLGDAVGCAVAGQEVPKGYYRLDRMTASVLRHDGAVAACGTCLDARGISEDGLVEGARRGTLDELADRTVWAEKVVTF